MGVTVCTLVSCCEFFIEDTVRQLITRYRSITDYEIISMDNLGNLRDIRQGYDLKRGLGIEAYTGRNVVLLYVVNMREHGREHVSNSDSTYKG